MLKTTINVLVHLLLTLDYFWNMEVIFASVGYLEKNVL